MSSGEGRLGRRTWEGACAAALLLRPFLIVPMTSSGPLRDSIMVPIGLASVFAFHVLLAAGVLAGNRLMLAVAIVTALLGVVLATIGACAGLPLPWPAAMAAHNIVLAAVGMETWRRRPGR